MANFIQFTTFSIFYHQSVSFLEKSQKFLFQGGVHQQFFEFFKFFELFHTEVAQNDPQWQIFQNGDLDWLQTANFGHFACFSSFL